MVVKEIQEFAQIRTKARAYLCYILSRNISQNIDGASLDIVLKNIQKIKQSLPQSELIYAIDKNGIQITENYSSNPKLQELGKGEDRSNRAYYYRTISEHRCILTDPYPSLISNELVVTSSFPIYDNEDNLLCIVCVDITLHDILKMVHPTSIDSSFGTVSKVVYGAFSLALFAIAMLLFVKGITSLLAFGVDFSKIEINEMFHSTILLTLSLALVDLVKAIFEEEVLGREKKGHTSDTHQTMVRFLGSIIIALSIEALMLVFKFALTDPSKLLYAVYLIGGITALIFGLSAYLNANKKTKESK
ncbi:MAG: PDC sensor domain-containing protein [Campylobacterales bacterium]|nr:PDC sensor domain-containing protein [Campylobacterales bacterium]